MFTEKKVLITGGTGSFGNVFARHLIKNTNVKEVRIFSRDEKKQEDMRIDLNCDKVKFYIGDVREYSSVKFAMQGVNYVFSAAALKQVPSCEFYPIEAVRTNVLGSENVLNAAISNCVEKLVVLSTDKAVLPINAMGMSKALMEKLMIAKSRGVDCSNITMCATRYGNVMASRGSVIPLFVNQIKKGNPLTITDPTMTRFLMSLEDAMKLVLYAFQHANGGDIFVQKAPATTIHDLALALKDIFNSTSQINIIGTRHGEKKHETLLTREERERSEDLGQYFRISSDNRDLNYNLYFTEGAPGISELPDYTSENTNRLNLAQIKDLLLNLDFIKSELRK